MNLKTFFFLITIFFFLLLSPNIIWADSWCPATWSEYMCGERKCGGDILTRNCWQYCDNLQQECETIKVEVCDEETGECLEEEQTNCWDVCLSCATECGSPSVYDNCENWQICQNGGWGQSIPECQCTGSCLETPKNPRYYDNPTYSDQLDKDIGNTNIKLPVKLDWDDVEGWGQEDGPRSYNITIHNTQSTDPFRDNITESSIIPPSCTLKSNATHNWGVKACCGADGTNCGSESSWNLSTNLAPEPVSPTDPDWTEERGGEDIAIPVTLDWCDVEEAESYQVKINIIEEGKEICHPWLTVGAECQPLRISKKEAEGKTKWLLLSQFEDEKEGYFTKDTHYKWQVGVEIKNLGNFFGQIWEFVATGLITDFELIFPPNDPAGLKPVGLPLILDWRGKPGANSFVYEISPIAGGNPIAGVVLPSEVSFDYPKLNLDAFYKWRVWPCWDYAGKQCEEEFRGDWIFKTTGRPPQLDYPVSGAQDIHIPVNFKWEAVPGAKSYVLKVSGDGLNFEKAVDESEFSLDYPEYNIRQEKNYSWQVKTCAWKDGQTCGQFSPAQGFKTFRLPPPQNPFPENNGRLSTDEKYISWQKVPEAKAHQYKIKYLALAAAEENEECKALRGQEVIPVKTVPTNSDYVQLNCLGGYEWQASSCLDENCTETSNWSGPWAFGLAEPIEVGKGGLVPCGRSTDNPNTPWNEREPCHIKHIFLLIKVLIDFLLFRIAPLALVLLTVATGVMLYFPISTGGAAPLARIKSLWKSAGIGIVLVFCAWTLVNLILKLAGYQVGIFGNWYQL